MSSIFCLIRRPRRPRHTSHAVSATDTVDCLLVHPLNRYLTTAASQRHLTTHPLNPILLQRKTTRTNLVTRAANMCCLIPSLFARFFDDSPHTQYDTSSNAPRDPSRPTHYPPTSLLFACNRGKGGIKPASAKKGKSDALSSSTVPTTATTATPQEMKQVSPLAAAARSPTARSSGLATPADAITPIAEEDYDDNGGEGNSSGTLTRDNSGRTTRAVPTVPATPAADATVATKAAPAKPAATPSTAKRSTKSSKASLRFWRRQPKPKKDNGKGKARATDEDIDRENEIAALGPALAEIFTEPH